MSGRLMMWRLPRWGIDFGFFLPQVWVVWKCAVLGLWFPSLGGVFVCRS